MCTLRVPRYRFTALNSSFSLPKPFCNSFQITDGGTEEWRSYVCMPPCRNGKLLYKPGCYSSLHKTTRIFLQWLFQNNLSRTFFTCNSKIIFLNPFHFLDEVESKHLSTLPRFPKDTIASHKSSFLRYFHFQRFCGVESKKSNTFPLFMVFFVKVMISFHYGIRYSDKRLDKFRFYENPNDWNLNHSNFIGHINIMTLGRDVRIHKFPMQNDSSFCNSSDFRC